MKTLLIALMLLAPGLALGECPSADVDGDCWVYWEDFVLVADQWLSTGYVSADIDGDYKVNFCDFAILESQWLDVGTIEVPNVRHMAPSEAWVAITDAGLAAGTMTMEFSDMVDPGQVIGTIPAVGTELPPALEVDLIVSKGLDLIPTIEWVDIDDPGFVGRMSKYLITNGQYCRFLNAQLEEGNIGLGTDENQHKVVWPAESEQQIVYFVTNGAEYYSRIGYDGLEQKFVVSQGMENHPVVGVTWYGANAFADAYGWTLPDQWGWHAVANYDGSYTFACGMTIDCGKANYRASLAHCDPLSLGNPSTTPVDYYPSYGYGLNDMTGNAMEWTSSVYYDGTTPDDDKRMIRGSSWNNYDTHCRLSYIQFLGRREYANSEIGFRVCGSIPPNQD